MTQRIIVSSLVLSTRYFTVEETWLLCSLSQKTFQILAIQQNKLNRISSRCACLVSVPIIYSLSLLNFLSNGHHQYITFEMLIPTLPHISSYLLRLFCTLDFMLNSSESIYSNKHTRVSVQAKSGRFSHSFGQTLETKVDLS